MVKRLARRPITAVIGVIGVAAWLACVPSGLGGTCRFSGDDSSPCGQCIARSCQEPVNECCGSEVCTQNLGTLDRCATGSSCDALSSVSSALAACVAAACPMCSGPRRDGGTEDAAGPSEAGPHFTSACGTTGTYGCICAPGGPSGGTDTACTADSVNGGLCCADRGWPASGTQCSCAPFTCEAVKGSPFVDVRCRFEDLRTGITSATGSKCCVDVFLRECKCGPSDMGCEPENIVTHCAANVMRCSSSDSEVASCSF